MGDAFDPGGNFEKDLTPTSLKRFEFNVNNVKNVNNVRNANNVKDKKKKSTNFNQTNGGDEVYQFYEMPKSLTNLIIRKIFQNLCKSFLYINQCLLLIAHLDVTSLTFFSRWTPKILKISGALK